MKPKSVNYDIATPYTAVYLVFRQKHRIAFLLRQNTKWMNGYYGLPAGRVEKGESFKKAAIREANEEVGAILHSDKLKLILTGHRTNPDSLWVDLVFEALVWRGELYNAEPHIHAELAWLEPDNLPENVVPNVRHYIEQLQAGQNYAEFGWDS